MDFTKLFSLRSAQSERTVVSTTLSASSSLSRIPIKRNSSLRRNKEVMENYNNLQADETNHYPVSDQRDEYNELIDLDTRQSFSSSHSNQPYPQEPLAPRRWSCHRHQHRKAWKPAQRCRSLLKSRWWIVFTQNCCQYKQETAVQYKLRVVTIDDCNGLVQIQIDIKTQILMEGLVQIQKN